MEEVESLRTEITNQTDTSSVIQEQFKKQNDEVGLFVCLGWEMDGRVFYGVFQKSQTYAPNKTQKFKSGFGFSIC